MYTIFEKNSYWDAVLATDPLGGEAAVYKQSRKDLQFSFTTVNFEIYSKHHNLSNGCLNRIFGGPLYSGLAVARAIYWLAAAILGGIFFCCDYEYFRARLYCLARELQEAFGWLVAIIHQKYGQYHIAESQFYKASYECFLLKRNLDHRWNACNGSTSKMRELAYEYKKIGCLKKVLLAAEGKGDNEYLLEGVGEEFVNRGDKETALRVRSLLIYDCNKDSITKKIAAAYFAEGNFVKVLETSHSIENQLSFGFVHDVAEEYLKLGDREGLKDILKNHFLPYDSRQSFVERLAESYFTEGLLEDAMAILEECHASQQEAMHIKVAKAYLLLDDRINAMNAISHWSVDHEKRAQITLKVADLHYAEGNLDNAEEVLGEFRINSVSETIIDETSIKISNAYFSRDMLEKGMGVFNRYYTFSKKSSEFIAKGIELFYQSGNLHKAIGYLKKAPAYSLLCDTKFIAQACRFLIQKGEREEVIPLIDKFDLNLNKKYKILIQLARSYYSENNRNRAINMIERIVRISLKECYYHAEIMNLGIYLCVMDRQKKEADAFFQALANKCLDAIQNNFGNVEDSLLIERMINISTDKSTIHDFMKIYQDYYDRKEAEARKEAQAGNGYRPKTKEEIKAEYERKRLPYYQLLKLQPGATQPQIRTAFYTISKTAHPDKAGQEATEHYQKIVQAYKILIGDEELPEDFD